MIAFATLFLGLVVGPQTVDLVVGDEVATVEIRLNERTVTTLRGEPCSHQVDFGPELIPQELVAIARDAEEQEIGRARQWINLPRPLADVSVVLDGGNGAPRVARLIWESLAGAEPQAVRVAFDGVPLAIEDPQRIVLPPHDERQFHFLRAELEFAENVFSVVEVAFGGLSSEVSTELTAIPVLTRGRRSPKPERLAGLLVKDGEPLPVVGVEKGPAQIVVVADLGSLEPLADLSRFRFDRRVSEENRTEKLLRVATLHRDQFVRFLWPITQRQAGLHNTYDLFPSSQELDGEDAGLYFFLANASTPPGDKQRLADAVAVAGLSAAGERQRRAVVLVLGPAPADESYLTPEQARRYLEHLRVPLHVWSLAGDDAGAWGPARDVSSLTRFEDAAEELAKELDRQSVVWIDGVHLPQEITLAPAAAAAGLALAQ